MKQKLSLVLRFAETEWGETPREWVTVIPEKRLSQIRFKRWKILAYTGERTTEVVRASCLARADFLFLVKVKYAASCHP